VTTTIAVPIFRLDLNLKQGAGAVITLNTVDQLGQVITNPTGYTVRAQIRRTPTGPVLYEWNTGMGNATLTYTPSPTPVSETVLTLTGAQSALFGFRLAVWDCFLMAPLQEPACLAAGVVRVDPWVTHQ
jgi:hypothetical protein